MKYLIIVAVIGAFLVASAALQIVGFRGGGAGFLGAAVALEIAVAMAGRKERTSC